jgi:hypothetical protein
MQAMQKTTPVKDEAELARIERFAWGIARGFSIREAANQAGYSEKTKSVYKRRKNTEFDARVKDLEAVIRWTQDEPGLMVAELMRCAAKAQSLDSGAAMDAAHKSIVAAARLRQAQPPVAMEPPPPTLSLDEWMARFGTQE